MQHLRVMSSQDAGQLAVLVPDAPGPVPTGVEIDLVDERERAKIRAASGRLPRPPSFTVVVPLDGTNDGLVEAERDPSRLGVMFLKKTPPASGLAAIESAITASASLRAWLSAADARLASMLATEVSFPEQTIAGCTRESVRDAAKSTERADGKIMVLSVEETIRAKLIAAFSPEALQVVGVQSPTIRLP